MFFPKPENRLVCGFHGIHGFFSHFLKMLAALLTAEEGVNVPPDGLQQRLGVIVQACRATGTDSVSTVGAWPRALGLALVSGALLVCTGRTQGESSPSQTPTASRRGSTVSPESTPIAHVRAQHALQGVHKYLGKTARSSETPGLLPGTRGQQAGKDLPPLERLTLSMSGNSGIAQPCGPCAPYAGTRTTRTRGLCKDTVNAENTILRGNSPQQQKEAATISLNEDP